MSQNVFYIYTLAYPDGTVFYVGKGKGKRIDQHEAEAKRGVASYKCNVIRQIWRDDGQVIKTKICEHMEEKAAYQLEIDLIRMYGREHLCNLTDGGEGADAGNKNALLGRHGSIVLRLDVATVDLLYDALALEGNASPSSAEITDAVFYAIRTIYGRRIEDQQAIIV